MVPGYRVTYLRNIYPDFFCASTGDVVLKTSHFQGFKCYEMALIILPIFRVKVPFNDVSLRNRLHFMDYRISHGHVNN